MKIRAYIYLLCSLWLMAACTTDTDTDGNGVTSGKVRVGLRINTFDGTTITRADANATTDEMMNIWTVVVVNDDNTSPDYNKVVAIHACKPTGTARDEDDYVDLTPGTYRFYSFANMAPSVVMNLLGIGGTGATGVAVTRADGDPGSNAGTTNDTIPSYNVSNDDTFYSTVTSDEVHEITFTDGATVDETTATAAVATVGGNGFNPTAANNFGAQGIPMSNVQTKEITGSTTFNLVLVRMMAKMELQITNRTGADVNISRITLSNVTQNTADNLKLLPTLSNPDSKSATPRDIRPNLGTAAVQDNYTWINGVSITAGSTETVSFYVNESDTPTNADGLFYLTLELSDGSYRYALISDDASNNWNYIARNDYRIIPVTLDDVKFELIPYDFPPIGVYPVSVKQLADHLYDFEFHDYGHFHLVPQVTRGGTAIAYATTPASSGYSWSLIDGDWSKSFFTYARRGDATQTANPGAFYATSSATTDADDNGGVPVLDATTVWNGVSPFIFGYIAEPPAAWWSSPTDRRVYHEMKIQIYKDGAAYRQAIYRFYMTLSASQMLSAPARGTAPRRPHGH